MFPVVLWPFCIVLRGKDSESVAETISHLENEFELE